MSLNELTSASCINIMLTKWVQVSIPLLNLSVLCFFTTLENLERLINPNICAKILILDLDMVFVLVSNPKLGKTLPCPFFILDACDLNYCMTLVWSLVIRLPSQCPNNPSGIIHRIPKFLYGWKDILQKLSMVRNLRFNKDKLPGSPGMVF